MAKSLKVKSFRKKFQNSEEDSEKDKSYSLLLWLLQKILRKHLLEKVKASVKSQRNPGSFWKAGAQRKLEGRTKLGTPEGESDLIESSILAQDERWRRA